MEVQVDIKNETWSFVEEESEQETKDSDTSSEIKTFTAFVKGFEQTVHQTNTK